MIKKYSMILLLGLLFVTQIACAQSSSKTASANASAKSVTSGTALYQNSRLGLTLYQSGDWKKKLETSNTKGTNLVFEQNQLRVVVSVVSNTDSFKEVKATILKSVVDPKIISQSDSYLDVKSQLSSPINIVSYIKNKGDHNYIFSFVSPTKLLNQNNPIMKSFMSHVQIN